MIFFSVSCFSAALWGFHVKGPTPWHTQFTRLVTICCTSLGPDPEGCTDLHISVLSMQHPCGPGTQATPIPAILENGFQLLSPSLHVTSSKKPSLIQRLDAIVPS